MVYQYKLANFEGPLDLLLHLIEKHAIAIYDIPIVEITEQYMAYLDTWNQFDMEYSSEFLVMAATLLHIKSRMLLPLAQTEEEEEEDPRDALVQRLVEYQQIKMMAEVLATRQGALETSFAREDSCSEWGTQAVVDLRDVSLFTLFQEVVTRWKTQEEPAPPPEVSVTKETVSVPEAAERLRSHIHIHGYVAFRKYMLALPDRTWLVNSFLAILEMLKERVLLLQPHHGDVLLRKGEAYDSV